jgi:probable rRNA maturation factor
VTRPIYLGQFRVDITARDGVRIPVPRVSLARAVAAAADAADAPMPSSVSLILSDDAELATLNAEHMGHEGPTDVLSFPLLPPEAFSAPGAAPVFAGAAFVLPPGRRPHLGDIVISVERAAAQAAEGRGGQTGDVRWSTSQELLLLAIHGTLHLCGWDHAEPAEEASMRSVEAQLLAALGRAGDFRIHRLR